MSLMDQKLGPRWLLSFTGMAAACVGACTLYLNSSLALIFAGIMFFAARDQAFGFGRHLEIYRFGELMRSEEVMRRKPALGGALTGACIGALLAGLLLAFWSFIRGPV